MKNNKFFKNFQVIILSIAFLIVLIVPFIYIYIRKPSKEFWDGAIGDLLATVIALIAGIPIALWIDRQVKKNEDREKNRLARIEENKRLSLIREELDFNFNSLFLKGKKGNVSTMTVQPFKTDLWDALVTTGEIIYIENPDLLNRITSAYYILKTVKDIEQQAYIALRTSAVQFTDTHGISKTSAQLLLQDARGFDVLFADSVEEAIKKIDKRRKEISKREK